MDSNNSSLTIRIASSNQILEGSHTLFICRHKDKRQIAFLFRFEGECLAYLNKCVHMPFRLDCEANTVFNNTKDNLKCSMHGIVYHPKTGESLSPTMCTGEKLTPIKINEFEGSVWIEDELVKAASLDLEDNI